MVKGPRVLIVDDEPDFITILSIRLKNAGYDVETASNGREGVEKAKGTSPDVIVMDIMMPELDGIAAVLKLKSLKETNSIPIIVCTAVREKEDEIVAGNLRVADYYKKSSPMEELITKIGKTLGE